MRVIIFAIIVLMAFPTLAQGELSYIVFTHDGRVWAQPTDGGNRINIGIAPADVSNTLPTRDVYSLAAAPITRPMDDGWGFYHGVWSVDGNRFAYLEINPPEFRVRVIENGDDDIVLTGQSNEGFGYLDPIAFRVDGSIYLLERRAFTHLREVKIFVYDPTNEILDFSGGGYVGHTVGRSVSIPDSSQLFVGFDIDSNTAVIFDRFNNRISRIPVSLPAERKGFEHLPMRVYGAVTQADLLSFAQTLPKQKSIAIETSRPAPFLYWPLADTHRYITCLPDAEWVYRQYSTNCPGLAGRNYEGHQGTDVSQRPEPLPIGTPVYAASVGRVVHSYRDCLGVNPSCNNAYGNTLTLEHHLIVDGAVQVWYTGYGHLQMVLVEDERLITDLNQPIALSGATGVGGSHLHFEVRTPDDWVDPWDDVDGEGLWVGGNAMPTASVLVDDMVAVPRVLDVCTSYAGNNMRQGAGTTHDVVGETIAGMTYYITSIENVQSGGAIGDWYEVLYDGGEGWLWSGVMNCPQ